MPYTLGQKDFKSKKDITKYFKTYKETKQENDILEEPYKSVMVDLVSWHPNYNEKWVDETTEFKIGIDSYGLKNFRIKNKNGWSVFSYLKCIRAHTPEKNHRFNVQRACRKAIKKQIEEFKSEAEQNGFWECEIDGNMYLGYEIHVDHNFEIITFQQLLDNFLDTLGKSYLDIKLISTDGHLLGKQDKKDWREYHRLYCVLRCIHKKYNLSKKNN